MSNRIRFSYTNEGKDFSFPYDLERDTHRERLKNTLKWAARMGVTCQIESDELSNGRSPETESDSAGLNRVINR